MKYEVISAKRNQTAVNVLPSHPDGNFVYFDILFGTWHTIGSITLRDIKPRHVRALERGDVSVMSKYVKTEPGRHDLITFTENCRPRIPDPTAPGWETGLRRAQEQAPIIDAQVVAEPIPTLA